MLFRLGGELCALPMGSVRVILHMAATARPPGLPSILEGFLDLAGTAVPVLRTARLYGLPGRDPGLYTPLLILHGEAHPVALLVDEVSGTLVTGRDHLHAVKDGQVLNGCVEAELEAAGKSVHLLCPQRILLDEERQRLIELQAMAQKRSQELEQSGNG